MSDRKTNHWHDQHQLPANQRILRPISTPADPAEILRPVERQKRRIAPIFLVVAVIGVGVAEVAKPFGFSPMLTVGQAISNIKIPWIYDGNMSKLCYEEQSRIAQRLAEAEQEYADAMGQCSFLSTWGGVLDPALGTMGRAICEQGVRERFQVTLRQLRQAQAKAKECQI